MTPHIWFLISHHIPKAAHGYSYRKYCLELFPTPFTDALSLKAVEVELWRGWNIHTLWIRIPCYLLCSPFQIYFDKTWELSLATRQQRGAVSSWDNFFPPFPLPLYSHTSSWEGSCCTKSKCAFSAAGVGAVVGSEHMEAGKGSLTQQCKQQCRNGGAIIPASFQFHVMVLYPHYLPCVCLKGIGKYF